LKKKYRFLNNKNIKLQVSIQIKCVRVVAKILNTIAIISLLNKIEIDKRQIISRSYFRLQFTIEIARLLQITNTNIEKTLEKRARKLKKLRNTYIDKEKAKKKN